MSSKNPKMVIQSMKSIRRVWKSLILESNIKLSNKRQRNCRLESAEEQRSPHISVQTICPLVTTDSYIRQATNSANLTVLASYNST